MLVRRALLDKEGNMTIEFKVPTPEMCFGFSTSNSDQTIFQAPQAEPLSRSELDQAIGTMHSAQQIGWASRSRADNKWRSVDQVQGGLINGYRVQRGKDAHILYHR
jgi:hypothetical protein